MPEPIRHDPRWSLDSRRVATFSQYALVAAEEALEDAAWHPTEESELEATVRIPRIGVLLPCSPLTIR